MGKLTLGPLFYHWDAQKRRDFYFRIADEAPIDSVYLGEMVCSKREVFFEPYRQEVIERLIKAGKEVVISTLALLTLKRELEQVQSLAQGGLMIEANDVAAVQALQGRAFVVGPTVNVLNEGSMDFMVAQGAKRIVFASELTGKAICTLATRHPAIEKEVQVYGRQPLAISMRCYHARANGRDKDHCQFACSEDSDGLPVDTMEGKGILTVNGTQTLSHGYVMLLDECKEMVASGVTHFRLVPQDVDMVQVATQYRGLLDGKNESESVRRTLISLNKAVPSLNGFYHGCAGKEYVA